MRKNKCLPVLILLSAALCACASVSPANRPDRCLPHFPDRDGWYGGDGAYSIPLDAQRTLWLFGDTFVSNDSERKDRVGMDVVLGNTLALSACSTAHAFSIRYFIKKQNSIFATFFGENEMLWPQDPFIADGVLHIPLLIVKILPDAPAPFNFAVAGHKIARIRDFSNSDPRNWPVEYLDWTGAIPPGVEALATTSIVDGHYVYFFPLYRDKNTHGNILMRLPLKRLEQPAGAFEFFSQAGVWERQWPQDGINIMFGAAVSELSVRYHAQAKKWLAVYLSGTDQGRKLLLQSSQRLEGPWSPPLPVIESIAETDPESPLYDRNTFCYAGKEHHQFTRDKNLVITYVCNSPEDPLHPAGFLRRNLFLYRPVVKTVACPSNICH